MNHQLDFLSIVSSYSFKRLAGKTQVLTGFNNPHIRDRLSHSLEVAAITKLIYFQLPDVLKNLINPDALQNISLLHDIGHPPYGHFGTDVLHEAFFMHGVPFEDNANSLVVIEKELSHISELSKVSIIKYPFEFNPDKGKGLYDYQVTKYLPLLSKIINQQNLNHAIPRNTTYECDIMELADDIAYLTGDIEDAVYYSDVQIDEFLLKSIFDNLGIFNEYVFEYLVDTTKNNVRDKMNTLRNILIQNIDFSMEQNEFVFKVPSYNDFYLVLREICFEKFIKSFSIRYDEKFANLFKKYIHWLINEIDNPDTIKQHMLSRTYYKKYIGTYDKTKKLMFLLSSIAESTDAWVFKKLNEFKTMQEEALWKN